MRPRSVAAQQSWSPPISAASDVSTPRPTSHTLLRDDLLALALPRIAWMGRQEAGATACRAFSFRDSNVHAMVPALLVIAHTKAPCEAVKKHQTDGLAVCRALEACKHPGQAQLCPESVARQTVQDTLATIASDPKRTPEHFWSQEKVKQHATVAAWYAQGPLSPHVTQVIARSTYRRVEPDAPDCSDPRAPADKPCHCTDRRLRDAVCGIDPGSERNEHAAGSCRFRVDDRRKVIEVTRPSR